MHAIPQVQSCRPVDLQPFPGRSAARLSRLVRAVSLKDLRDCSSGTEPRQKAPKSDRKRQKATFLEPVDRTQSDRRAAAPVKGGPSGNRPLAIDGKPNVLSAALTVHTTVSLHVT